MDLKRVTSTTIIWMTNGPSDTMDTAIMTDVGILPKRKLDGQTPQEACHPKMTCRISTWWKANYRWCRCSLDMVPNTLDKTPTWIWARTVTQRKIPSAVNTSAWEAGDRWCRAYPNSARSRRIYTMRFSSSAKKFHRRQCVRPFGGCHCTVTDRTRSTSVSLRLPPRTTDFALKPVRRL